MNLAQTVPYARALTFGCAPISKEMLSFSTRTCPWVDFLFPQHLESSACVSEVTYGGLRVLLIWQNGAEDVKKHRWFKTVDWDAVPNRKLKVNCRLNPTCHTR